MRIGTWNIDKPPAGARHLPQVRQVTEEADCDAWILTETVDHLTPFENGTVLHSLELPLNSNTPPHSRQVSVHCRYPLLRRFEVPDPFYAAAGLFDAPGGPLLLYGLILSYHGRRNHFDGSEWPVWGLHRHQVQLFSRHWRELAGEAERMVVAGDFNTTLDPDDRFYGLKDTRKQLNETLNELDWTALTTSPRMIDHLCVSRPLAASFDRLEWLNPNNEAFPKQRGIHVGAVAQFREAPVG